MKDRDALTPDPDFQAKLVHLCGNRISAMGCARAAMGIPLASSDPVFRSTPLAKGDYGSLLAYMLRRFGHPNLQGDHRKDLSGGWLLSTPLPELHLMVWPNVTTASFSFDPRVPRGVVGEARRDDDYADRLRDAYRTALIDLLRPVPVRDLYVNAVGKVERGDPLRDDVRLAVEPNRGACLPSPPGLPDNWMNLVGLAERLGDGDTAKGFAELVRLGEGVAPRAGAAA